MLALVQDPLIEFSSDDARNKQNTIMARSDPNIKKRKIREVLFE